MGHHSDTVPPQLTKGVRRKLIRRETPRKPTITLKELQDLASTGHSLHVTSELWGRWLERNLFLCDKICYSSMRSEFYDFLVQKQDISSPKEVWCWQHYTTVCSCSSLAGNQDKGKDRIAEYQLLHIPNTWRTISR